MKKLLLILGMFIASFSFLAITAQAETVAIKKVIEVPGATQEQVFNKVRDWSSRYAQDYSADVKSGIIVANGEVTYPSPPIDRIQHTFVFKMKNTINGNKVTVTFEDVMLKTPVRDISHDTFGGLTTIGGELEPLKSGKDITAANKILNYTSDNFKDYLLSKTETACPLLRCPECGVLCPTSPDMKEHEKGHGGHGHAPAPTQ